MARGLNKVMIIGHLGADPETRTFPSGGSVTNLRVATTEAWKDRDTGEQQERTEWHRVSLFGKLGEIAAEYLRKGSQVYIEGSIRTRKWQDKQGQDRYSTEIVGKDMQMLGGKGGSGGGRRSSNDSLPDDEYDQQRDEGRSSGTGQQKPRTQDDLDDDIPFGWAAVIPFAGLLVWAAHAASTTQALLSV